MDRDEFLDQLPDWASGDTLRKLAPVRYSTQAKFAAQHRFQFRRNYLNSE
jgi:hypothetical protein